MKVRPEHYGDRDALPICHGHRNAIYGKISLIHLKKFKKEMTLMHYYTVIPVDNILNKNEGDRLQVLRSRKRRLRSKYIFVKTIKNSIRTENLPSNKLDMDKATSLRTPFTAFTRDLNTKQIW